MRLNGYRVMWIIIIFILVVGFIIASKYDLPISHAVHDPRNKFGHIMEGLGWLPAFFSFIFLFMLCGSASTAGSPGKLMFGILALVGAGILGGIADNYTKKYDDNGQSFFRWWYVFAFLALCLYIYILYSAKMTPIFRQKMLWFTSTSSVFLISIVVVVNLIKIIWMRTRFDEMLILNDFSGFTTWYSPFGKGGRSFPSGHTAHAAGILSLLFLCDAFPAYAKYKSTICILCLIYVGLMAATRIILGRHFLSDTLASVSIVSALFLFIQHSHWYKEGLYKILQ